MLLPIHLKITFTTAQTVPNADLGQLNFRLLNYLYECAMGLYDCRVCPDCLIAYDAYIGSHIGCALLIQLSGLFFPFICSTTPASPTVIDQLNQQSATLWGLCLYAIDQVSSDTTIYCSPSNSGNFGRSQAYIRWSTWPLHNWRERL